MVAAVDWLTEFRRFWGASFNRLDDLLVELKQAQKPNKTPKPT